MPISAGFHLLKKSPKENLVQPMVIEILVERSPLWLSCALQHSTGTLLSGKFVLHVFESTVAVDLFRARLSCTTTTLRSFHNKCPSCNSHEFEVEQWNIWENSRILSKGEHEFPFSVVVPSHLPITTHGLLGHIDYHLMVEMLTPEQKSIRADIKVDIKRNSPLCEEINARQSFPSSDLTAQCTYPSIIHPDEEFPLRMQLKGTTSWLNNIKVRLCLQKLAWHIEEVQELVSLACPLHASKIARTRKSILHTDTRKVGHGEIQSGWNVDFDEGSIIVEFLAVVNSQSKPICDVDSKTGLSVSHSLVLEMTVAHEFCLRKNPAQMAPSTANKILRTRFPVVLTHKNLSGMDGVEEWLPTYNVEPPVYVQLHG